MDSHTGLSTQILNNPDLSQKLLDELVPIIYRELSAGLIIGDNAVNVRARLITSCTATPRHRRN